MEYYEPAEDTELMLKALQSAKLAPKRSLEVGCGSGAISKYLAEISNEHIGVDINPHAIEASKALAPNATFTESDLFQNVSGKFDCIVFNPPYLPDASDPEDWVKKATVGGKKGYEVILRFLEQLPTHLANDGVCYLLFSQLSKPDVILPYIEKQLLSVKLVAEASVMMEKLFVYEIKKQSARVALEAVMQDITFLAKGKHGILFTGVANEMKVTAKVSLHHAPATIEKEAQNLQKVNALGIGPKYLKHTDSYVLYGYVEGTLLKDWLPSASKEDVHTMIISIVEQCSVLDSAKFDKTEMTNPYKHIVCGQSFVMLDFERGHISESPSNVTQFLQYICRSECTDVLQKFNVNFDLEKIKKIGASYAETYDVQPVLAYINSQF